jgi:uncharacterized membrane protein
MNKLNIRALKARGSELAGANRAHTTPIVLVYCGVLALLTLGSSGLNLYLNNQMGSTGGLGGMGMRAVLQTVEEILGYINLIFAPYWTAGFLAAMLTMVRGGTPGCMDLTAGFRRLFQVLGFLAFEFGVTFALMMAAAYPAAMIFSFTPLGADFAGLITTADLTVLPLEELVRAMFPMLVLTMVIFLPLYIFVFYGFRMALYLIMERQITAVQAYFLSSRLMKGRRWELFRMDLSFWWYYALMGLASAVGYLDVYLGLLGISLPIDPLVMFFGTLVLYCAAVTALSLWKKCDVEAAYVLAYEQIAHPEPAEELSQVE